jgi:hypothetical protein
VLGASARTVLRRAAPELTDPDHAAACLIGPIFFWIMTGRDPALLDTRALARDFLRDRAELPGCSSPAAGIA